MTDFPPPIPPPAADPRTPHLGLPLPAPDANAMRTDAARIAAALEMLDADAQRHDLHQLLKLDL